MRWLGFGRKENSAVNGAEAKLSENLRNRGRLASRRRTRLIGFEALEERTLLSGGSHRVSELTEHVARAHKHRHGDRADVFRTPPPVSTTTGSTAIAGAMSGGQTSQTLTNLTTSAPTEHKPQSKVWRYDDKWWGVFPQTSGTYLWRLDGTSWTQILKLSTSSTTRADTLPVGDVTHILLYRGTTSDLASVQYVPATGTYEFWSQRPTLGTVPLPSGVEAATIAMDSTGRMWVAADGTTTVVAQYSDAPYASWSAPIQLVSGINTDDISVIGALPNGNVGVMWSNQSTKRFGFRLHTDGADPTVWSADEVPASQSALNIGGGMGDDHLNLAIASDSTLYAAVKTSYDTAGVVKIAMLVRRPNGTWDNLYEVDTLGTRPIVVLNEATGCVEIAYTAADSGGNIVGKQSALSPISFGPLQTVTSGTLNNVSSTRQNTTDEALFVSHGGGAVHGTLVTYSNVANQPPVVYAGPDQTIFGVTTTNIDGSAAGGQPNPPGAMTTTWSQFSGPGTVTFGDASVVDTTATFSAPGTYVLRLTGTDGGLSSHDDVTVVVYDFSLQTTSFQDGVFPTPAYSGTQDLRIRSGNANTNYQNNTTLGVDGSPDDAVLLKWDVTAIPQTSSVISATITINVTGTSTDDYEIYELKRDWVESQGTWNIAATGVNWSVPGADGVSVPADRGTTVLGTVGALNVGSVTIGLNAAGVAVVQAWVNNPSTNFGIVIQDYLNAADDLGFSSSEVSTLSFRPRLNVTYSTNANTAPDAVNDSRTTNVGTPLVIAVLSNDTDADGDTLTVTSASDPANGSTVVNADNTITYTPDPGFTGTDSFTYSISDGKGGTDSATVSMTVNPGNSPPDAVDDSRTTQVDAALVVAVLSNDTDPNGDTLTVTAASDPANGSTAVNADNTITYTPGPGFRGADSFTYSISDGNGGTDSATVSMTVNASPDAMDDGDTTNEDVAKTVTVLVNDTDADGDPLHVTSVSDPANRGAAVNPDGTISYTPDPQFNGSDTFTYQISDGKGGSDTATVMITVNAVNDAPSFTKGSNQSVLQDAGPQTVAAWATAISAGPANENTQAVTFSAMNDNNALFSAQPAIAPDGTLTFTPAAGATGSATVTLTVQDDGGTTNGGSDTSAPQTFTITVNSPNPPVTVSFQDGVNGYLGTRDSTIRSTSTNGNFASTSNLTAYGTTDDASLVKWDISSIPTSSTVVSASITFLLLNGAAAPEDYEMYEVLRPWVETEITWNQPAAGATWGSNGAQGAGDHGTDVVGTVGGTVLGLITITLNSAGVAMVQRWVSTPASNNGVVIQDYSATDWMSLASSEYSNATKRPKLTITYQ